MRKVAKIKMQEATTSIEDLSLVLIQLYLTKKIQK